mgnify:CR=1 FL=1
MKARYKYQLPVMTGRAKRLLLEKDIHVTVNNNMPLMGGTQPVTHRKDVKDGETPKALGEKARRMSKRMWLWMEYLSNEKCITEELGAVRIKYAP